MSDLIARLNDPDRRKARIRGRIRELQALRNRVDDELTVLTAELGEVRERRSRNVKPPCGTEQGYQWHRYRRDKYPPCDSCKAAHNAHERARAARKRLARAKGAA